MAERLLIQRGQLWRLERSVDNLGFVAGDLVLVIQNNPYNVNAAYPWCLVAAVGMTTPEVPTHVPFDAAENVTTLMDVGVRSERLGCVPKSWLTECVGQLSAPTMRRVEQAICKVLALP